MNNIKYAFLLSVCLVLQTTIAGQNTLPAGKDVESTPELKQSAVELLSEVARETGQYIVPENRIRTGTITAGLLWEHDERAARAIFQNIFTELQNTFASMRPPRDGMSPTERSEYFYRRERLAELRSEYVLTLAGHDPQGASVALAALKTKLLEEYDPLQPAKLELELASVIAKNDPEKAYALARTQLAAEGIAYGFIETLKDLHKKNSKLAADLGTDVLAKIRTSKIRVPTTTLSSARPSTNANEIDFWQVATFINVATEMKRRAERDKEQRLVPLLNDAEMRELVELIAREYLNEPNVNVNSIGQVMPEVLLHAPALAQRIRVKIGPKAARELENVTESAAYFNTLRKEKSIEELAQDAGRAAPAIRNQRYVDVVVKALDEDQPEKAQVIAANITDRQGYAFLFERLRVALPLAKARRGDTGEVRRMLASLKTDQERVATLAELAAALAAKGQMEAAKKLLDEASEIVLAKPISKAGLESAATIAAVYARVAPELAFLIAETGVEQMNKYIRAAILLEEFYDFGSTESGELLYDAANRQALLHVPNSTTLLRDLARADFKRTVRLADKLERSDLRLLVRLRIVQALLDPKAGETEKKMLEKTQAEHDEH